jgi:hypothetical protein
VPFQEVVSVIPEVIDEFEYLYSVSGLHGFECFCWD